MSAAQEIYGGLSWWGRMQAKIFFGVVVVFSILITVLLLVQLFSNVRVLLNKNKYTATQVQQARKKISNTLAGLLFTTIFFGILLALTYFNMKETEKSKQYAAATGAIELFNELIGQRGGVL